MKFGKYLLRIVVLVSVLLTLSVQADAHTLWVNFTDYMPSAGGSGQMKTKLYIGWGHHFPVDSFVKAEDFEKIVLRDPTGIEKNIALETTGFAAAALTLDKPGIYTAAATRKESMNTAYEEDGKKVTYKGPKTGKKNIISSVYSQQFAKSIICGGELITGDASHVFGQKLEIIPVTNPYEIMNNRGGIMKVKVLFEGKPVGVYIKVIRSRMRPLLLLQRMGKGLPLSVLITGEYGCCVPGMTVLLPVNWQRRSMKNITFHR